MPIHVEVNPSDRALDMDTEPFVVEVPQDRMTIVSTGKFLCFNVGRFGRAFHWDDISVFEACWIEKMERDRP